MPNCVGDRRSASIRLNSSARGVSGASPRFWSAALDSFLDLEVCVGVRRNLRQVRDAQDLERRPQRAKLATHDIGDSPADSGVDFVEDQTRRAVTRRPLAGFNEAVARGCGQRLDRQHDPRQLSPRHDSREWSKLLTRIGRDIELQLVHALRRP